MSAHIYIISEKNSDYYKVGYTAQAPLARLRELQTGNPRQLKLVRYVEIDDAYRVEQLLHAVLGKWHITREWFCIQPGDLDNAFTLFESVIEKRRR